jgi:signal transduction histidine kinase
MLPWKDAATAEHEARKELARLFRVQSHDLKSPLFVIQGFIELLTSDYADKLDEEGQDFLRRIRGSADQMKKVLEEMSRIVKLLSRPNALRPKPLRELVEEALLKYNYLIEEGGVRIELPDELPTVNCDEEKMREVICALISNALSFNDRPQGERTIVITCGEEGERYCLAVRDNGIGIDPRYAAQVFDLGLKLDKSRGGGPGYGLYLARRMAEAHGGSISVESAPDQGSTFCVTIPRPAATAPPP